MTQWCLWKMEDIVSILLRAERTDGTKRQRRVATRELCCAAGAVAVAVSVLMKVGSPKNGVQ